MSDSDNCFTPFAEPIDHIPLPDRFTNPFDYESHPLCAIAAGQLQAHLSTETKWEHNFGLNNSVDGPAAGKMFGVMVVRNSDQEIGYLAAFSGTLAGGNHHAGFVPPVYDGPAEDGFLNDGMAALGAITKEIEALENQHKDQMAKEVEALKIKRKTTANVITAKLFEQYHFLNQAGEEKSLLTIFKEELGIMPPGGAGECAAPKLLQYAFQHKMRPIAMAEFFWGVSRGSDHWQHLQYYPACQEKCGPILGWMLNGIEPGN